jgi:hypothetical protein
MIMSGPHGWIGMERMRDAMALRVDRPMILSDASAAFLFVSVEVGFPGKCYHFL